MMNDLYLYLKVNKELSCDRVDFILKSIIGGCFELEWEEDCLFGSIILVEPITQFVNLKINYEALCADLMDDITIVVVPRFENALADLVKEKCEPGIYPIVKVLPKLLSEDVSLLEKLSTFKSEVSNDILETIRSYLEFNMSVVMVARSIYAHRNTINYRITKFIEVTGIDIRSTLNGYYIYTLISWNNPVYNKEIEEEI